MEHTKVSSLDDNAAMMTDFYELTMAAGYYFSQFHKDWKTKAIFELFARKLPENRSYLVAAGLQQAVEYISNFTFNKDQIDYLKSLDIFRKIRRFF